MSLKNEIDPRIKVGCYCRFYVNTYYKVKNREKIKFQKKFDHKVKCRKRLVGTVESINFEDKTVVIVNLNIGKFNRKLSDVKFHS